MGQRQGEHGNRQNQHQQNGHQYLGKPLDAGVHTLVYDQHGGAQKNKEPEDGTPGGGDKARKVPVRHGRSAAAGQIGGQIFEDPAANGAVVRQNDYRHQTGDNAQPSPVAVQSPVGCQGTLTGFPANCDFRGQQSKTKGQHQNQVAQQKYTAAVLGCQIRKPPDISQAHGTAGCRQHKADRAGEIASLMLKFHRFLLQKISEQPYYCPFLTRYARIVYGLFPSVSRGSERNVLHGKTFWKMYWKNLNGSESFRFQTV